MTFYEAGRFRLNDVVTLGTKHLRDWFCGIRKGGGQGGGGWLSSTALGGCCAGLLIKGLYT